MRWFPALVLVLVLPVLARAADDGAGPARQAEAARAVIAALEGTDPAVAAHGAFEAGRLGLREVEGALVERLRVETAKPHDERSWALDQILLDALYQVEAVPPSEVLLPHLGDHRDTVVAILVQGRRAYPDALLRLYRTLTHHRAYLAWRAVGHALADAHGRRFLPVLLPDVEIRHVVVVRRPPAIYRGRRNPSSARPPPKLDVWRVRREIPRGFPPVPVHELTTSRGSRLLDLLGGVRLRRTEHTESTITLVRHCIETVSRSPPRLRWLDIVLARAGARIRRRLAAADQVVFDYTGRASFRRFLLPHREALLEAWWERIDGLLRRGLIDRAEAIRLATEVDLELEDRRRGRHRPLEPLPDLGRRNPFRPRAPRPVVSM